MESWRKLMYHIMEVPKYGERKSGAEKFPKFGGKYKGNVATRKQTSNGINLKKPKMLRGVIINI